MNIKIPYDIYESAHEIAIIVPLWWVEKESISITIQYETLHIKWKRIKPTIRKDFSIIQEQCFRWDIGLSIDLPPESNYKNMHSTLSKENILSIIIPKNIIPKSIPIKIEHE